MTELKYDPEFPYVVLIREDHRPDNILGKFSDIAYATQLKNAGIASLREIVDTTPKPKIPEDAEFIYWDNGAGKTVAVRENYNPNKPWEIDGVYFGEPELLLSIGDAEVTVLVRKEES